MATGIFHHLMDRVNRLENSFNRLIESQPPKISKKVAAIPDQRNPEIERRIARYDGLLHNVSHNIDDGRIKQLIEDFVSQKAGSNRQEDISHYVSYQSIDDIKLITDLFTQTDHKHNIIVDILEYFKPQEVFTQEKAQNELAMVYALMTGKRIPPQNIPTTLNTDERAHGEMAEQEALHEFAQSHELSDDILQRIQSPLRLLYAIIQAGYSVKDESLDYPKIEPLLDQFENQFCLRLNDTLSSIPGHFHG
ncbi:MAG: hypothetical protein HOA17_06910 [Candidatus Melainabacteria bacterium]|jgi:hypothetical protein|nr:hypothetical protein [Candidatus Melainabacteria bacterium]